MNAYVTIDVIKHLIRQQHIDSALLLIQKRFKYNGVNEQGLFSRLNQKNDSYKYLTLQDIFEQIMKHSINEHIQS